MNIAISRSLSMPSSIYRISIGSLGIGNTGFVIMGLLLNISRDFNISITLTAYSITAYAFGVVIGAHLLTQLLSKYNKNQF